MNQSDQSPETARKTQAEPYRMRLTYSSHGRFSSTIRDRESDRKIAQTAWFDTREEATRQGQTLLAQLLRDSGD